MPQPVRRGTILILKKGLLPYPFRQWAKLKNSNNAADQIKNILLNFQGPNYYQKITFIPLIKNETSKVILLIIINLYKLFSINIINLYKLLSMNILVPQVTRESMKRFKYLCILAPPFCYFFHHSPFICPAPAFLFLPCRAEGLLEC